MPKDWRAFYSLSHTYTACSCPKDRYHNMEKNAEDEECFLGTSSQLGHWFQPEFSGWVWKAFRLQLFYPSLQPPLPTTMGWQLTLKSPLEVTVKARLPSSFPIIFVLLLRTSSLFSSSFIFSQWHFTSKHTFDQEKHLFQIITPSSQSSPESPQHQCLSWVMHGMEAHTVCSRHWNHGNTPDERCYLGWS